MTSRKGADRLPDSTFFSCIIPQPRRDCNGGAVFFFSQGHPPPAKSFTDAKQNRCFCRLKNRETSVILVFESAVYITAGGLNLSGLTSGRRAFLLCPRRSTAKGGMLHDAFRDSGSAHVACNCGLWHVRHCVEDLQQQKMTAQSSPLVRSFLVIDLPERC